MIAIGDALSLRVVAEGVETREELAAVRDLGCEYAQGYLLARPCSFDEYWSTSKRAPRLRRLKEP